MAYLKYNSPEARRLRQQRMSDPGTRLSKPIKKPIVRPVNTKTIVSKNIRDKAEIAGNVAAKQISKLRPSAPKPYKGMRAVGRAVAERLPKPKPISNVASKKAEIAKIDRELKSLERQEALRRGWGAVEMNTPKRIVERKIALDRIKAEKERLNMNREQMMFNRSNEARKAVKMAKDISTYKRKEMMMKTKV